MSAVGTKMRSIEGGQLAFWCPGCNTAHGVVVDGSRGWSWDGNVEAPSFSPSVLVRSGHYCSNYKPGDSCWCTYNAAHPERPSKFTCSVCHSFVKNGQIQFLGDCTHALAGQTVPLPPFP
jgi:hypothetical protein